MPHLKIVWNPNMIKVIGIWFTQDLKECEAINYNSKFDPPDGFVTDLQKVCSQFVSNGRQDRIARKTTIKDVHNEGLNVPDIKNSKS